MHFNLRRKDDWKWNTGSTYSWYDGYTNRGNGTDIFSTIRFKRWLAPRPWGGGLVIQCEVPTVAPLGCHITWRRAWPLFHLFRWKVHIDSGSFTEHSQSCFVGHRRRRLQVLLGWVDCGNDMGGCCGGSTPSGGDEDGLDADCEWCHVDGCGCGMLDGVGKQGAVRGVKVVYMVAYHSPPQEPARDPWNPILIGRWCPLERFRDRCSTLWTRRLELSFIIDTFELTSLVSVARWLWYRY